MSFARLAPESGAADGLYALAARMLGLKRVSKFQVFIKGFFFFSHPLNSFLYLRHHASGRGLMQAQHVPGIQALNNPFEAVANLLGGKARDFDVLFQLQALH